MAQVRAADGDRFTWALSIPTPGIRAAVDLTELPQQGLVYVREWIQDEDLSSLVYPLWVPGTHAPSGPVQNLGGLSVADAEGKPLSWERDAHDPWKIKVLTSVPVHRVRLELTYIANHPSVNSTGVDCFGNAREALVNWNCLLFYPAQHPCATIACTLEARLPPGWDFATALHPLSHASDILRFGTTTLTEAIDRPLLCGPSVSHLVLRPDAAQPGVTLHIVAAHEHDGHLSEHDIAALSRLPDEEDQLFGGSWYDHFDMLLLLGDTSMGLEHGCCSVNGMRQSNFDDPCNLWSHELLPHEFTHSWVGKHRRPQGMLTPTYQETPVFDDLWVYEGLTELLGRVLAVRCGLISAETWRAGLAFDLLRLESTSGRSWRSLRDICRCTWQLRAHSANHPELRRSQDYYQEGALFWLVVDRRIRAATAGKHSLDDFCQRFFGPHGESAPGYSEAELVACLHDIVALDWAGMIRRWIDGTGDLDRQAILGGSGWSLKRIRVDPNNGDELAYVDLEAIRQAVGCDIEFGQIEDVQSGGPAAAAGLVDGDFLYSMDDTLLASDPAAFARGMATANILTPASLTVLRKNRLTTVQLLPRPLSIQALVRDETLQDDLTPLVLAHHHPLVRGGEP